jgi:hypothetical protein
VLDGILVRESRIDMRALLGLGISLALLLLDGAAQAQAIVPIGSARRSDAESAWEAHPLVLEVHLGLGMPLGLVGVAADYSVLDWWAVGVGGGVNNAGPQGAVLSRIRVVGNLRKALTVEAGYSLGNYQHGDFFDDVGGDTPANGWDTGYELRVSPAHFIYLGCNRWQHWFRHGVRHRFASAGCPNSRGILVADWGRSNRSVG